MQALCTSCKVENTTEGWRFKVPTASSMSVPILAQPHTKMRRRKSDANALKCPFVEECLHDEGLGAHPKQDSDRTQPELNYVAYACIKRYDGDCCMYVCMYVCVCMSADPVVRVRLKR